MFMLDGYAEQLWVGSILTIELSLLSLCLAFFLGLLGAAAKLSPVPMLRFVGGIYTTLVRGIPDLVLMLLLFYGLQMLVNGVTDFAGYGQMQINPFTAGVITIGVIYGAYFAETFRGARMAIAPGTLDAANAFGMPPALIFRRIIYPQMMRLAMPGIANNWQVILKSTAIVSLIGLTDIVRISQDAGRGTTRPLFFALLAGAIYLSISTVSSVVFRWVGRRYSIGFVSGLS